MLRALFSYGRGAPSPSQGGIAQGKAQQTWSTVGASRTRLRLPASGPSSAALPRPGLAAGPHPALREARAAPTRASPSCPRDPAAVLGGNRARPDLPVREHPSFVDSVRVTRGSAFLRACYRPRLLETYTIRTLKTNIQVFKVNKRYWKETTAV